MTVRSRRRVAWWRKGTAGVGVDDQTPRIRTPLGLLAVPHRPVQLGRTRLPNKAKGRHCRSHSTQMLPLLRIIQSQPHASKKRKKRTVVNPRSASRMG